MSLRGTMVTGTVLAATEFCDFYVLVKTLNPPTLKVNATVACRKFLCVTCSDAATEVSSLHVKMIYGTISSTSPVNPSTLTAYAANL